MEKRQPMGIELVKRGIVTESDIEKALDYQKTHTNKKIGDIINILGLCDSHVLINAVGEILEEKAIYLQEKDIRIDVQEYIALDLVKQYKAIPFEISSGKIKVCFADTSNKRSIDVIRLLLLNKGLVMEKYISFETNIDKIIEALEGTSAGNIDINADVSGLVDSIIKTAMEKRASDIHIEPLEKIVRVRYRIDGQLVDAAQIDKDKQAQIIGRLKAISNMHQEKQEAQDGRILLYEDYNIRVSSQPNVYGEKFVLRLLKKNTDIRSIFELGFPYDENYFKKSINKKNSIEELKNKLKEIKIIVDNEKRRVGISVYDYLKNPTSNLKNIIEEHNLDINYPQDVIEEVEIQIKYEGYIKKIEREAEKMLKNEEKQIPTNIDYDKIPNLASEARQKLKEVRPLNIAQAIRISGVNPADISILLVYLRKQYNE